MPGFDVIVGLVIARAVGHLPEVANEVLGQVTADRSASAARAAMVKLFGDRAEAREIRHAAESSTAWLAEQPQSAVRDCVEAVEPEGWPEIAAAVRDLQGDLLGHQLRRAIRQVFEFSAVDHPASVRRQAADLYYEMLLRALETVSLVAPRARSLLHDIRNERVLQACRASQAGEEVLVPRHNIPSPMNPRFVGREAELEKLVALLVVGDGEPGVPRPPVCLSGSAGIGKTQLAQQFAHLQRDAFDAVAWIDGRGDDIEAAVSEAGAVLGLVFPDSVPISDRATAVKHALERGNRHLVVFDDVVTSGVIEPFVPSHPSCSVLVTSRRRDLPFVERMDMPPLGSEHGAALLLHGATAACADSPEVAALVESLGDCTLALELAGRVLSTGVETPSSLLDWIRREGVGSWVDRTGDRLLEDGGGPTLARLFDRSIELLEGADPVDCWARALLFAAGVFARAPIPYDMLLNTAINVRLPAQRRSGVRWLFDRLVQPKPVVAKHPDVNPRDALARLVSLGLATVDEQRMVNVHALLQEYLEQRYGAAVGKAFVNTAWFMCFVSSTAPESLLQITPYVPHLARVLDALRGRRYPDTYCSIPVVLYTYYEQRGEYENALEVAKLGQEMARTGARKAMFLRAEADSLGYLGRYDDSRRRLEEGTGLMARKGWFQRSPHIESASTMHSMARILNKQGRYDEAFDLVRKAKARLEQDKGVDHPDTLSALSYEANILCSVDRYEEALDIVERVIRVFKTTHGEDSTALIGPYLTYGEVLMHMNRLEEAVRILAESHRIAEHVYGEVHPVTASTVDSLGVAYQRQGRYGEALEAYERSLGVRRDMFGDEHPGLARVLAARGQVLADLGRQEEGYASLEEARDLIEKHHGAVHPTLFAVHGEAGQAALAMGHGEVAVEHFLSAKAILESTGRAHSRDMAVLLSSLARAEMGAGDAAGASSTVQRSYEMAQAEIDPDHPDMVTIASAAAEVAADCGDHARSREMAEFAHSLSASSMGEQHPDRLIVAINLAMKQYAEGDETALERAAIAFDKLEAVLGKDHPHVTTGRDVLVRVLAGRMMANSTFAALDDAKGSRGERVRRPKKKQRRKKPARRKKKSKRKRK